MNEIQVIDIPAAKQTLADACDGDLALAKDIWSGYFTATHPQGEFLYADEVSELLVKAAQRQVFKAVPTFHTKNAEQVAAYMAHVEHARAFPGSVGYITGFAKLDKMLKLTAGSVTTLIGPPSSGKSALAIQLGARISAGGRVLYVLTEMSRKECEDRLVAQAAQIHVEHVQQPMTDEHVASIREGAMWCAENVDIEWIDARGKSFGYVNEEVRKYYAAYGAPRALITDNLWGLVNSSSIGTDPNAQSRGISTMVQAFSALAQPAPVGIDTAVIIVHHTKGDVQRGQDPSDNGAGGSVGVLQFSDNLLQIVKQPRQPLNPDQLYETRKELDVTHKLWCIKNRRGPSDWSIDMKFDGPMMSFRETNGPVLERFFQVAAPDPEREARQKAAEEELPGF